MDRLSISEICNLIRGGKLFEASSADGGFTIKINRYVPYVCTAIHDGSRLRKNLVDQTLLNEYQRWYEEDPYTGDFINSMPITIIGHDSRFEYDLNRRPEECVYEEAWGNQVWKRKLSAKAKKESLQKHQNYYTVLKALVGTLEERFEACVVYDIHSYNYKRWDREVPVFNVGIERVDSERFKGTIGHWQAELDGLVINQVPAKCGINDVFYGRGYNLEFLTKTFKNTLVLATEVSKIYCNEETGEDYPKIIKELQQKLKKAILNNALFFSNKHTTWSSSKPLNLLDKKIDPAILKVDKGLTRLLKNFELLGAVNPNNLGLEQKRFFKNKFTLPPKFNYPPSKINPFELKQKLSALPVQQISDVTIRNLYETVINSYFDKIDLVSSLNTKKFLYNSLRYFGRPSKTDLHNALYLLKLPKIPSEPKNPRKIPLDEVISAFKTALDGYGIACKIELSTRVISQVMVLNSKKTILFRPDAEFTEKEVKALIEHEIGVHMVTTQNSLNQDLKLFHLGFPVNTKTQEGIAILSEYLSGNITLNRLKKLALRVVLTDMMCNGASFTDCFQLLVQEHAFNTHDAFTMVTRIYRGGGFTKDYLYLNGFAQALKLWKSGKDLTPLLVGKTSFEHYDVILEMMERDLVKEPTYITKSWLEPHPDHQSELYNYILSGLK